MAIKSKTNKKTNSAQPKKQKQKQTEPSRTEPNQNVLLFLAHTESRGGPLPRDQKEDSITPPPPHTPIKLHGNQTKGKKRQTDGRMDAWADR
jgi:hypothetical protein